MSEEQSVDTSEERRERVAYRAFIAQLKWPLLSLVPTTEPQHFHGYEHRKPFHLHVRADDPTFARACLADDDALAFICTQIALGSIGHCGPSGPISFHPNDVLRQLGRDVGGANRRALRNSLRRLHNTAVHTDLRPHGERRSTFFNILEDIALAPANPRAPWEVRPAPWLTEQVQARHLLKLDAVYLVLRGLERRIAGLARAYSGGSGFETWRVPLGVLHAQCGSSDATRKFRHAVRQIANANKIVGYKLAVVVDANKGEWLKIFRLDAPVAPTSAMTLKAQSHVPALFLPDVPDDPHIPPELFIDMDDDSPLPPRIPLNR